MKLFYNILFLLGVLELVVAKPVNNTSNTSISAAAEQLVKIYNEEYDLMIQDVCVKIKNITKEILKDERIQNAATPSLLQFKIIMTQLQLLYRFYKCNETVIDFSDTIEGYFHHHRKKNDDNLLYIKQLLKNVGYSEIREKYKREFKKFMDEKFLPKAEEFKKQLTQQTNKIEPDLKVLKWIDSLKICQDYECFLIDFSTYKRKTGSFLELLAEDIARSIFKGLIINAQNLYVFANDVLKDSKLSLLSSPVRQQLTKNLQDMVKFFDRANAVHHMYTFLFASNLLLYKFDNLTSISLADRQIITETFNDHGFEKFDLEPKKKKETKNLDYITQHIEMEKSLSSHELKEMKQLLEAVDRVTNATTAQEINEAFKDIEHILKNSKN